MSLPNPPHNPSADLRRLEPVPTLLRRLRDELAASFVPERPIRVSRAPGRLDVMGGIADYTGSLVCQATLDRAAAVALQTRGDREVQVFSFNLYDEHRPCTLRIPLASLANSSIEALRREFNEPGRKWAGYLAGCLVVLHEAGLVDLNRDEMPGLNLALYSDVPLGAGVSSSAAIEVATMMALRDHFNLGDRITPMKLAALCQRVENVIVGAPCGIMDQAASCAGQSGQLLRLLCQPHELLPPLRLPHGIRAVGVNSNVKHSVGGGMYGLTRCAAFMGHTMILAKMREIGAAAGRPLQSDPMKGYLANLPLDDYKTYFRGYLPENMSGAAFLRQYGPTIDSATTVDPDVEYHVQSATDHHVFEASRVRNFVDFLEQAAKLDAGDPQRSKLLNMAGHLMYASHLSYTQSARLGADECDVLVDLVRRYEPVGLYGGKITGGGSGGTVAILCNDTPRVDESLQSLMRDYQNQTGQTPDVFLHDSPGAWEVGTILL